MRDAKLRPRDVEVIIKHGCWNRARRDREIYWIPDSPFIESVAPELSAVINLAVVIAEGNVVVSVYHRDDRFREGELK